MVHRLEEIEWSLSLPEELLRAEVLGGTTPREKAYRPEENLF